MMRPMASATPTTAAFVSPATPGSASSRVASNRSFWMPAMTSETGTKSTPIVR